MNNPKNYRVETLVATVGIRGTGFDALCSGPCESRPEITPPAEPVDAPAAIEPGDGLFVTTWEGEVEVSNPAGALVVAVGQAVLVTGRDRAPVYLPEVPPVLRDLPGPRPDGIKIDMRELFGAAAVAHTERGLYVLVKEGSIAVTQEQMTLTLERGEAAYANFEGTELNRLQFTPVFLERDSVLSAPSAGGLICAPF
jgi:hypothetical protein